MDGEENNPSVLEKLDSFIFFLTQGKMGKVKRNYIV